VPEISFANISKTHSSSRIICFYAYFNPNRALETRINQVEISVGIGFLGIDMTKRNSICGFFVRLKKLNYGFKLRAR
jgi:hypothetical protein